MSPPPPPPDHTHSTFPVRPISGVELLRLLDADESLEAGIAWLLSREGHPAQSFRSACCYPGSCKAPTSPPPPPPPALSLFRMCNPLQSENPRNRPLGKLFQSWLPQHGQRLEISQRVGRDSIPSQPAIVQTLSDLEAAFLTAAGLHLLAGSSLQQSASTAL